MRQGNNNKLAHFGKRTVSKLCSVFCVGGFYCRVSLAVTFDGQQYHGGVDY